MSAGNWKELYSATIEGNLNLVEYHVKNGVNVNYQHPEILMTVLVAAIKEKHTKIAIYLLRNGANPRLESHFDQLTPLSAAMKYKVQDVLDELNSMGVRQSWLERLLSKFIC
jgi:ankyrin repeat protein